MSHFWSQMTGYKHGYNESRYRTFFYGPRVFVITKKSPNTFVLQFDVIAEKTRLMLCMNILYFSSGNPSLSGPTPFNEYVNIARGSNGCSRWIFFSRRLIFIEILCAAFMRSFYAQLLCAAFMRSFYAHKMKLTGGVNFINFL